MEFFFVLAVLYILKAAVIMLDRKSLIEKSQFFNVSYHLPEREMNSTPADAGVFFCQEHQARYAVPHVLPVRIARKIRTAAGRMASGKS